MLADCSGVLQRAAEAQSDMNAAPPSTHFPWLSILPAWPASQRFAQMILLRLIHFNYLSPIAFCPLLKTLQMPNCISGFCHQLLSGLVLISSLGLFSDAGEGQKPNAGSCLFVCFAGAGTKQVFTVSPGKGPPILWSALC